MKQIYIYGFSGHGQVVADVARSVGYDEIVFLDDAGELKFSPDLPKFDIFIAIGNCKIRQMLQEKVRSAGFNVVNLIHPSAVISSSVKLGRGIAIMPNAVINANALICDGVILNSGSVIEHDCVVGEFAHICPKVALAGNVKVGKRAWIGIGSCVIQGKSIGDDTLIGAGSVIVKDIASNAKAYGNPCKVVSQI
ncbi:UDP-4-amino-4,6-dideoxy-alpha-D-N-acetyl-D-glucosamine N-acetyltransferase [Campylobacter iguaniorum]|uniref:UDP-N-acetylbacillosamine N-acetyltransferase n=1 Tax=Campylobacter iguaniorum TaxID=1244531 RepID=UPI0007C900E8|nr:UDP-N-acetylbacillosamine N-acetyltransferase [Campylobacter iguaniorum]ANE36338.1 UDP-4-amino-4,6-dideoxy-alpha-D-N-acetyl-D-glucosamine N-acetyltransferase [Campylobacter iguaniorum]